MKYIFIFAISFFLINCKTISDDQTIDMTAQFEGDQEVSRENPIIVFETNYHDDNNIFNIDDIEENTKFDLEITGTETGTKYVSKCRLWKSLDSPVYKPNIQIFCKPENNLEKTEVFSVKVTKNIKYLTYNINIVFNAKDRLYKSNKNLPFVYPGYKEIIVSENEEKADVEFKYESYNNEQLYLWYQDEGVFLALENCKKDNKILKCEISRENIDMGYNRDYIFRLIYDINNPNHLFEKFSYDMAQLSFKYPEIQKEDIYLKLEKLLEHESDMNNYFAYETNVTQLPKLNTLNFKTQNFECKFVKYDESTPLYLICFGIKSGNYTFGNEGFNKNDINYKYNFILTSEGLNDEIIHISENNGFSISYQSSLILDYSSKDTFIIPLFNNARLKNLRFNLDGEDIICGDNDKCTVPKSHFKGKNGTYFLNTKNSFGKYVKIYELFPYQVIIPEDNKENSSQINKGSIALILLLCLGLL